MGAVDGGSSIGRALHRDATAVPIDQALEDVHSGLADLPARSLEPGVYRAVLSPQATNTLLAVYGQIALGGRQVLGGASSTSGRLGAQLTSPLVTLEGHGGGGQRPPAKLQSAGFF